jgi:predicted dehydrogenase
MRFLVVGTGSIGQRHARNLAALGQDVLAWDPDERRRAQTAEIPGVAVMASQAEALAARPDAVVVCTPPAHHVAVARSALDAGAHVFIEKPIAHESAAVPALIAEAARRGVRLAVGFNLRLLPSLARVRALLDAKRIGRVLSARVEFGAYLPDWRPGRDYRDGYAVSAALGGGILLDAIHELDYLGWLLGDADEVVAATEHASDLAGDTEDLAEVTIRFASGVLAQVHLDYVQRAYRRTFHVIGADGVIEWNYPAHTVTVHDADGAPHLEDYRALDGEPNDMYVEEMRHFIRSVQGAEPPLVDGREALRSLLLVEAAKRSSRERRWVKLG